MEIYNNTDTDDVVSATDGSSGYGVFASDISAGYLIYSRSDRDPSRELKNAMLIVGNEKLIVQFGN